MKLGAKIALLAVCLSAATSWCVAQSLGDLARQERERRAQQTRHTPVITNEDLKRDRILPAVPVVPAPATSSLPVAPPAVIPAAPNVPLWHVAEQPGFSLGDYARDLRVAKQQRQAEQNAKSVAPKPEVDRGASALVRSVTRSAHADIHPVTRREPAKLVVPRSAPAAVKARVVLPKPEAVRLPHRAHPRTQIRRTQEPDPSVVVVERGDSLWRIAEDLFGDGRLWTALWHANPNVSNPNRIFVGQTLRVPAPTQLAQLRLTLHKTIAHAHTALPAPAASASAAHVASSSAAQLQAPAQPASNPRR